MKQALSSLELYYLCQEFQELVSGKVDKIYQPSKEEFLFSFHVPNKGKKMLKVFLPGFCYLTDYKGQQPDKPSGFCLFLRRHLTNARLQEVTQLAFERILFFTFTTKDDVITLIIELIPPGNVILCNKEHKIISAATTQTRKDRTVRGGVLYEALHQPYNFLILTKEDLQQVVEKSTKDSLVKTLALDLGLGGIYAEELCLRALVDKQKKIFTVQEMHQLFTAMTTLRTMQINAQIVTDEHNAVHDITPFILLRYAQEKAFVLKPMQSYNAALDECLTERKMVEVKKKTLSHYDTSIGKLQLILQEQEEKVKEYEKSEALYKSYGELLYQHYSLVQSLLQELNKARKEHSWEEIKEKAKGHPHIKQILEKEGKIVLALE
ncbi:NFACT family protein [Candidatus Woesearchaeota archaeon]|nr:NFACT family protein [Candidatus Woesearchaeota archaeon]